MNAGHGSTHSKAAGRRNRRLRLVAPIRCKFGASISGGCRTRSGPPLGRPTKHTTSPAHFLRELKRLGDVGFVAPRAARPVLVPPQRGQIRTNVVVGLAGVSHCLRGTHLRHPSIISQTPPLLIDADHRNSFFAAAIIPHLGDIRSR
jgi:hypothetical protein